MSIENQKSGFNLFWISKYRDELFGLAIISIVLFHFSVDFVSALDKGIIGYGPILWKSHAIEEYFKFISSIGVEIFVLLSGMGLYFSFSKNSNICQFYKKRYLKILPPYLIVAAIFWAFKDFKFQGEGIKEYLADISFCTFFTDGVHTIWFIALLIVLYLAFPLIYKLLNKEKGRLSWLVLLLIITYGGPIIMYYIEPELYAKLSIAATRIPLFVIGCFAGSHIKNGTVIKYKYIVLFCIISFAAKFIRVYAHLDNYINRYLDGLYACGLLLALTGLLVVFREYDLFNKILRFFGKYSLEIYMTHVAMRNLMKEFGFDAYRISQYFIMVVLAVILSVILNLLCNAATNLFIKKG